MKFISMNLEKCDIIGTGFLFVCMANRRLEQVEIKFHPSEGVSEDRMTLR